MQNVGRFGHSAATKPLQNRVDSASYFAQGEALPCSQPHSLFCCLCGRKPALTTHMSPWRELVLAPSEAQVNLQKRLTPMSKEKSCCILVIQPHQLSSCPICRLKSYSDFWFYWNCHLHLPAPHAEACLPQHLHLEPSDRDKWSHPAHSPVKGSYMAILKNNCVPISKHILFGVSMHFLLGEKLLISSSLLIPFKNHIIFFHVIILASKSLFIVFTGLEGYAEA